MTEGLLLRQEKLGASLPPKHYFKKEQRSEQFALYSLPGIVNNHLHLA
jgi:hypothetical protein